MAVTAVPAPDVAAIVSQADGPTTIDGVPVAGDKKRTPVKKVALAAPPGGWSEFPKEWNATKHLPIPLKDFASPVPYWEHRVGRLTKDLKRAEMELANAKKYGGNEALMKQMKQLNAAASKFAAYYEELRKIDPAFNAEDLIRAAIEAGDAS